MSRISTGHSLDKDSDNEDSAYTDNKGPHYENMPIQIYWKFHHQKLKLYR